MSRTRNRYKHKKIEKAALDLMTFFSQALYQHSPKLRRSMRLEELEEEVAFTSDYFVSWMETRKVKTANPYPLPLDTGGASSPRSTGSEAADNPITRAFFWEQMRLMADLATGVWRMRRELNDGTDLHTPDQQKLAQRFLTGVWDRIQDAGISTLDYTGSAEEAKTNFFIIPQESDSQSEELPGIETVKPAIYYRSEERTLQIQVGHAIDRRLPIH